MPPEVLEQHLSKVRAPACLLPFAKRCVLWECVLLDGVRQDSESKEALMLGKEANTRYLKKPAMNK